MLRWIGIQGPLWFQSPEWSKPSLVALGLWGVGNTMVIFLAAVLDVPRHLYESAEIDGAGPLQRLRWVTLPTISPVILFAVVLGVIQGLQYFTQAYVAAGVASGQASQAADVTSSSLGYPLNSTLFYPVLLYQHGFSDFEMGYASAMAVILLGVSFVVTMVIVLNSRKWVHQAVAKVTSAGVTEPFVRRRPPAAVRRRKFLLGVANHTVLIAAAIAFLAPFGFITLTALMTNDQTLSSHLWPTRSTGPTSTTSSRPRRCCAGRTTRCSTPCWERSGSCSRACRSPTRSPGSVGAGATWRSWSCSSR